MTVGALKALVLDVDGVLTDGRLHYGEAGETLKVFHAHDGYGLKKIMKAGIKVAIISGRKSAPLVKRLDDLGIADVFLGVHDKLPVLKDWLERENLNPGDVAYMGDDIPDLACMRFVGCACAPSNAHTEVKRAVRFVTHLAGGSGAVREACDHLFQSAMQSAGQGHQP